MSFRPAVCLVVLLASSTLASAQSGSFQLKIFQGYNLSSQRVLESGASDADVSFTYQVRRFGIISYLHAAKISQVDNVNGLTAAQVNTWDDSVSAPTPGRYVIKSRNGRYYLLTLQSFQNQGKAASYWLLSFNYKEISVSGRAASQPSPAAPKPAEQKREFSAPTSAAAGSALKPSGRRDSFAALQDKVVVEVKVQTSMTVGYRGDVYAVALFRAGTNERISNTMFSKTGEAAIDVKPGRYDVWVLSGNDRAKFIRTIDLTSSRPGDIVPVTFRVDGFDTRVEDLRRGLDTPSTASSSGSSRTEAEDVDALRRRIRAESEQADREAAALRRKLKAEEEESERLRQELRRRNQ